MPATVLGAWSIKTPWCYGVWVVAFAFAIRVFLSFLKAIEAHTNRPSLSFGDLWWWKFKGKKGHSDYWQPFVMGLVELGTFPVLMAIGKFEYIGAWVGFKVVAQAVLWKEQRNVFSRFLIGTALCLLGSYWLATEFVTLPCTP